MRFLYLLLNKTLSIRNFITYFKEMFFCFVNEHVSYCECLRNVRIVFEVQLAIKFNIQGDIFPLLDSYHSFGLIKKALKSFEIHLKHITLSLNPYHMFFLTIPCNATQGLESELEVLLSY